jgi:hypothetical protein
MAFPGTKAKTPARWEKNKERQDGLALFYLKIE